MQTQKIMIHQSLQPSLRLRHLVPGSQSFTLVGGAVGLLAFFFLGLLPTVLLGGSAGAQLARAIHGGTAAGSLTNAVMVTGVLVATALGAALFAALGAAAGAAVSALTGRRVASKVSP